MRPFAKVFMMSFALTPLALAACQMALPEEDSGQTGGALYADYCAGCHGADAKGGQMIEGRKTANLTVLAKANGGVFPTRYVMSTIDGYARNDTHGPMPHFGGLLDGNMTVWVDEKGVETPTPEALILLAEYLEGKQG